MNTKLTSEQAKGLLDDLFNLPDAQPKAKAPKAPKAVKAPTGITPARITTLGKPVLSIIEVVTQECTTCGGVHEFIRGRRVRFEQKGGASYEYCTVVTDNLPRRVDQIWERTDVCPTCIKLSTHVEDYLAALNGVETTYVQGELFHG